MKLMGAILALGLGACATAPHPLPGDRPVERREVAQFPIASSVAVPPGHDIVYVSGTVPDAANAAAPEGSAERYGDTEAQTRSVLSKIRSELGERRLGLRDVVMMRVFLVAPPGQDRMDFAGFMRGYNAFFGTAEQPNKPARSTMEVAGLVNPAWLVEIEVTAAAKVDRRQAAAN